MSEPEPPQPSSSSTRNEVRDALLVEQQACWQRGERVLVEAWLEQRPELRNDTEAVLQLILHEVHLRQERGETPELAEYQRRFPHLAEPLAIQFEFERVLGADAAPGTAGLSTVPGAPPHGAAQGPPLAGLPRIAGYEVLGELGRGGMGVVYKARQARLNRPVALKMLLAGPLASAEEARRFRAEAEAAARLQHPNVVQIHEVGEHQGHPYLALEFVEGGSLADRLRGVPLPPRAAAELVETLARAVQAAHEKGVVHRDLKPGNVLLTADGTPKVADFGLAKRLDATSAATQSGAVLGTPAYMAPEQAGGKAREVGPAADVWALGALLYECLTGRPPFQGRTPTDTLLRVLSDEPVPPRNVNPAVPRDLETIALKCLRKEPAKRYATAAELADDLRRFLHGESICARRVSRVERLWRWCRRKPALTTAAVCALLAGGIAGLFAHQAHSTEQQRRTEKRQYAEERALLAAMSGDASGAARAIGEAESLGASPGQMHLLRGQVAFHQGDVEAARGYLERAVSLMPDSVAATAMLALACFHSGRGTRFEQLALDLDEMQPRTPEDFLFKGQVESRTRPEQALRTLDRAVSLRNSAIARVVRLGARCNHALFTDDVDVAESALKDAEVAREMLPDNPVVLANSVDASLVAAGVFAVRGQPERSRAALKQAGRDARALESFHSSPMALVARFNYYSAVGDEKAALTVSGMGREFHHALMLYRHRDYDKALAAADRAVARGSAPARFERGFILAEMSDGQRRAWGAFEEARAANDLGTFRLYTAAIPLLLGRKPDAVRASLAIRADPTPPVARWYKGWYHRYLDYLCDLIPEDEFLRAAGRCRPKLSDAHFVIGLRHLADGDRKGATAHFRQCADTRVFIYWDHMWARAFLKRLEDDSAWPPWIPPRKPTRAKP
jgi:tRNA A-37 threonylcarbamoyl transferase component Bud32/tetratricopeptide (TPR) repeat protein